MATCPSANNPRIKGYWLQQLSGGQVANLSYCVILCVFSSPEGFASGLFPATVVEKPSVDDFFQEALPQPKPLPVKPKPGAAAKKTAVVYPLYASVALNQPMEQLFTYGVPPALEPQLTQGSLVLAPFGGKQVRGCVVELASQPPSGIAPEKIRPLLHILSPGFHIQKDLLCLARWISDYYMCSEGEALSSVSFIGFNDVEKKVLLRYRLADNWKELLEPAPEAGLTASTEEDGKRTTASRTARLTAKQKALIEHLQAEEDASFSAEELKAATGAGTAVIQKLVDREILSRCEEIQMRHDEYERFPKRDTPLELNFSQQAAFDRICRALHEKRAATFLLHGVTNSGKTEVYLQAIEQVLREGGCVILCVPEITLTPQTVGRLRSRFGGNVGVYHSRLTLGQKYDLWQRVRNGECRIMVGARSAVFTPFENLRLIILDEEHETSYKQDSAPRYHACTVAIERARQLSAVVVLGSATPSIDTYYQTQTGKIELLALPDRIDQRPLPEVRIINMTQEAKDAHNTDLFSTILRQQMDVALERNEQILLLLNRRGFFNFLLCMSCNTVAECVHCSISLTHHKPGNKLHCHYCNRTYVLFKKCPKCESSDLSLVGIGTQRVEERVRELYPAARVIRMDLDTTRKRTAFLDAWKKIERGDAEVILGTQMIAKGFHLENVTLVAVPLADVSLFQPDFRSAERAFSLLTQVAGRAGRGDKPGRVMIQTYVPHHYAIHYAQTHNYHGFYDKEIRVRKILRFPPHFRLISLLASGPNAERTAGLIKEFARCLRNAAFATQEAITVLGPTPAPISRINDNYRWRLLIRGTDHKLMKSVLLKAREAFQKLPGQSSVQLIVDVDPQDLL